MMVPAHIWHTLSIVETAEHLHTDLRDGLSSREAALRQERYGLNELKEKERLPAWKRFAAQFQDFMVLVLLGATLISAMLGEYTDAITILAIVIINAVLGFIQETRAERSLEALREMTAPTAEVVRNSHVQRLLARELVPGDVIILNSGDKVPADARLLESNNITVDEAVLTGESVPVLKQADKIFVADTSLGDRKNMVYAGTVITRGRGRAVVCATGMATEVGQIADLIQQAPETDTPLQRRLEKLGHTLVWGCLIVCLVVVFAGLLRGEAIFLMAMSGISLAVAAIPEGLPAVVTVALALGVQRMIRRQAIVRKLPAVETLGCTTVICSDKTGTMTQNAMTVRHICTVAGSFDVTGQGYDPNGSFRRGTEEIAPQRHKDLHQCLIIASLCNNAVLKQSNVNISGFWRKNTVRWQIEGDPTEGALLVAGAKAGLWREVLEKTQRRVAENPFEAERRRMSTVYQSPDGETLVYAKGAVDTILALCDHYLAGEREMPLTPEIAAKILAQNADMASAALRVLALAYRRLSPQHSDYSAEAVEQHLVFAGLAGMIDPPRQAVKEAIALAKQAGIKTVMITGDHQDTAVAVARELGLLEHGRSRVLTGHDLDTLDERALTRLVDDVAVYARVSPSHKLRIVRALKQCGHIVAMTGDGVNDAPAVKEADIGIAMGQAGTEVTKDASAMVLADDNYATIVAAVEEGRGIYDNVRKFIRYLLACNTGEVLTMFLTTLAGLPLPLLPIQILWVNLVTDGLPAMALGVDPVDRDVMHRPPRQPDESVFSRGLSHKIILRGLQIGLSTVGVFWGVLSLSGDLTQARTMAFAVLVFCQLFHVLDCRSEVASVFEVGLWSNKYLLLAIAASALMQLLVIYHPLFRGIFGTAVLAPLDWLVVMLVSGWTFFTGLVRYLLRRRRITRPAYSRA